MVSSDVEIARMALSRIGAQTNIESFDSESAEARQAKLWYPLARDTVLSRFNWNFAKKTAKLSLHSVAPSSDWGYRYSLPTDLLVVREVINPLGKTAETPAHSIENVADVPTLLTDVEEAELIYTARVETVSIYPAPFVQALVAYLGSLLAPNLLGTAGAKVAVELTQEYERLVNIAGAYNANEEKPTPDEPPSWIKIR